MCTSTFTLPFRQAVTQVRLWSQQKSCRMWTCIIGDQLGEQVQDLDWTAHMSQRRPGVFLQNTNWGYGIFYAKPLLAIGTSPRCSGSHEAWLDSATSSIFRLYPGNGKGHDHTLRHSSCHSCFCSWKVHRRAVFWHQGKGKKRKAENC